MKPWMWGALALVLLTLAGIVFGTMIGPLLFGATTPAPDPAQVAETEPDVDADTAAALPPPPVQPEPATDETDAPVLSGGPGSDPSIPAPPDITPEHITEAEFNQVLDEVIDACGLGDWSEIERRCEGLRCTWMLAQPPPEQGFPTHDGVILCPAWKDTWGLQTDSIATRVTCDDGVELEIANLGPTTLRMRRAIEDEGASFIDDIEDLKTRACAAWGT